MLETADILCFEGSKLTSMIEVGWPLQVVLVVLDSWICLHSRIIISILDFFWSLFLSMVCKLGCSKSWKSGGTDLRISQAKVLQWSLATFSKRENHLWCLSLRKAVYVASNPVMVRMVRESTKTLSILKKVISTEKNF
jgi:hypothetical protein